jgi:hypothetical protein
MRAGRPFRRSELSECVDTRLFSMAAPPRAPAREAARMVLIGCAARPFSAVTFVGFQPLLRRMKGGAVRSHPRRRSEGGGERIVHPPFRRSDTGTPLLGRPDCRFQHARNRPARCTFQHGKNYRPPFFKARKTHRSHGGPSSSPPVGCRDTPSCRNGACQSAPPPACPWKPLR